MAAGLIKTLTDHLFAPEERRLAGYISKLNQRNKKLSEIKTDGFLYAGVFYQPADATLVLDRHQYKPSLHISLQADMEKHMRDRAEVMEERALISQTLFLLLKPCYSNQDYRDALPECLASLLKLTHMPRTREMAYTIEHNARAKRQFEKILPKMEIYSTAGLLY